ncbi:unnamed protein product, partial [Discosporangium mesarthrocarpum]
QVFTVQEKFSLFSVRSFPFLLPLPPRGKPSPGSDSFCEYTTCGHYAVLHRTRLCFFATVVLACAVDSPCPGKSSSTLQSLRNPLGPSGQGALITSLTLPYLQP